MSAGLEQLDAGEARELRTLFFAQAGELLDQVQAGLLRLEREGADAETTRAVKRALHTIKGDATSMGFADAGELCHRLEDVLLHATGEAGRLAAGVELLLAGVDALGGLLAAGEGGAAGAAAVAGRIATYLAATPAAAAGTHGALSAAQREAAREAEAGGLRLLLVEVAIHPECQERQVGALLVRERLRGCAVPIAAWPDPEAPDAAGASAYRFLVGAADPAAVRAAALLAGVATVATVAPWKDVAEAAGGAAAGARKGGQERGDAGEILRVEAGKVDRILDLIGELIIGRSMLEQVVREAGEHRAAGDELLERLGAVSAYLERTVGDLQGGALRMRMVPLRFLFKKFPRVVRDLAHQLGKSARLELHGQETELDKGIVDALFEPLTHLVRNMVDHGIEAPAARQAAGKPAEGLITLRAYQEAARIVVEVADDGAGIDTEKLVHRALERGLLDPAAAAALAPADACRLVFHSGLSTAEAVTATSGRGVGMDAVQTALEAMKGSVEVESRPGAGTCFRLRLPMTLAVIRTLLFDAGGRLFALPVAAIAEVARVRRGDLRTVDGNPCLLLRGELVSVVGLGELLAGADAETGGEGYVLVLALRGRRFGLLVERLRLQQELVIKSVDERWIDTGVVAGASILGDGRVVLVLDELAVVRRAIEARRRRVAAP